MWNVLGFGLGISKGCHTICGIFTGEALFFLGFPRVAIYTVKNKNSRGFIKKSMYLGTQTQPTPPSCLDF